MRPLPVGILLLAVVLAAAEPPYFGKMSPGCQREFKAASGRENQMSKRYAQRTANGVYYEC